MIRTTIFDVFLGNLLAVLTVIIVIVFFAGFLVHLIERSDRRRDDLEHGPCHDESRLLGTTAGSPSHYKCPNDNHRMRVQIATHPSNEEAAALVFCECAETER